MLTQNYSETLVRVRFGSQADIPGGLRDVRYSPKDGVIGRPGLWIAEDFRVLRFRLMVKALARSHRELFVRQAFWRETGAISTASWKLHAGPLLEDEPSRIQLPRGVHIPSV